MKLVSKTVIIRDKLRTCIIDTTGEQTSFFVLNDSEDFVELPIRRVVWEQVLFPAWQKISNEIHST
tara:strand:- start:483 stop:680 length:198 start_codon:yes stop_codon:yes gene_type:complete